MLPEEDRPPAWLRDYGDIEADITKMEEFAARLDAEVRENYGPHAQSLYEDMQAEIPSPYAAFQELSAFVVTHNSAQSNLSNTVWDYQNATGRFATAATEISERYRGSDAFSAARVRDVESALAPSPDGSVPAPPSTTMPAPEITTGPEAS
ncbi:hypothetical protein SAMN05444365_101361 [Micromonospora pattaloongensis]|uniref:Excreted virulence factor EspC, type VII ESX diderm n=1 Tax=Micromonospora pattaloongensis TaxID=405436 RepID=A0A1H3GEM0_9ACTN|nr:hypothetical protein [Micromonospora pattaloongensis]SDY00934.1 hypothetical protein SAMN05444365_101361 [Micromonospora pattaloongensis]